MAVLLEDDRRIIKMSVYKRPLRSDELMHAGRIASFVKKNNDSFTKDREKNLSSYKYNEYYGPKAVSRRTNEFDSLNSEIADVKSKISNPTPRERAYLDEYKRHLQVLYEKKQQLKDKWSRIKAEADANK